MIMGKKKAIRLTIILSLLFTVGFVPIFLLYVGTKKSGIDLQSALHGEWTLEPFIRLFSGLSDSEISFRESLPRSVAYATIVALFSSFLAFFYVNWATGWTRKAAISMSFTLLCLTLMPQTYFVMPALVFIQKLPFSLPKSFTIVLSILFGVLPLASWILYMMSSRKIAELQEMCALDRLGSVHSWVRIFNEIRVDMILVFLLSWSIAWGNYLVPYSLGSRDSFTSVVQITTFTSNLGRDWAMICAAGFIVCIPGVIIGSVLVGVFFRKDQ